MNSHSKPIYACIHAAEFPAQVLLRLRLDLQGEPVAVLDGVAPQEFVCSINGQARRLGVACGITRLEAEAIPGLRLLTRSREAEAAGRLVVLERTAKFSPRIEDAGEGTACAFVLDLTGSEQLFGQPAQIGERLRDDLSAAGFRVSIAISVNFHTARMKAAASRGVTVIPAGEEAVALAKLPLAAFNLNKEHLETFAIWGIRSLGELASLPEDELISRLGLQASAWRQAAWGELPHMFQAIEPEFALREFIEFDFPIEEMDSLLFVGARMIDALVERAASRALALARIAVKMKMEGGATHELALRPAIPSVDRKFLLKLLQLEIAAHPPEAAVMRLELTAEAAPSSLVQLGLFTPQTPEPSRLDVTLARLKAIVGEDRVGSPALEDTHRPGSFHMESFAVDCKANAHDFAGAHLAMRRMRPSVSVRVSLRGMEPASFASRHDRYTITAAYGPWRTSGNWWSAGEWNLDEWDVMAVRDDGTAIACLLVHDRKRDEWELEAVYD